MSDDELEETEARAAKIESFIKARQDLSVSEKGILWALVTMFREQGGEPIKGASARVLEPACGISKSRVHDHLAALERKGIIGRVEAAPGEMTPRYVFLLRDEKTPAASSFITQQSGGTMVEIHQSADGRNYSIVTDANDERTFLSEFSALFSREHAPIDPRILRSAMPLAVEICCRLRGYKANVHEKRLLWTGNMPPEKISLISGGDTQSDQPNGESRPAGSAIQ